MRQAIPFLTSAGTLWAMWEIGNKRARGWVIGLCNQALWIATSVAFGTWGLLPLTAVLTVVYTRNLRRWRAEARAAA